MEIRSVKWKKKKKRKKIVKEEANGFVEEDMISNLPDSLIHQILILLPLQSAAKTSSLSRRWRSLFLSLPDLDFTSVNENPKPPSSFSSNSIYQVLSLRDHRDSNNLRSLRFRVPITFTSLNSLIRLAVTHQVQDLDVEVITKDYFNFPRWIVTSQNLRALKLKSSCPGFRLPPSSSISGGFQKLTSLSLSLLILDKQPYLFDFFTDPNFPLLEKLALENCFGLKQLKVSCCLLQEFTLTNSLQLDGLEVCGNNLKRLKVVSCFHSYSEESFVKINTPNLKTFLWNSNAVTTNVHFLDKLVCLRKAFVGVLLHHQDLSSQTQSLFTLLSGLCHSYKLQLGNQSVEVYLYTYVHIFFFFSSVISMLHCLINFLTDFVKQEGISKDPSSTVSEHEILGTANTF